MDIVQTDVNRDGSAGLLILRSVLRTNTLRGSFLVSHVWFNSCKEDEFKEFAEAGLKVEIG